MYDITVIGAGPAGLTSAIYARRSSKKVLVLEAKTYGGQIINVNDIENYPAAPHISGFEFATKIYNQAKELGAEIKFEKAIDIKDGDIKEVITNKDSYKTKTIIIATGSENRKLGLDNEDELLGKGISYCATCDGAFYKNKTVAVVGGGDAAIDEAIYLSNLATKVYLIHRRDSLKGEEIDIEKLRNKKNVEFIYNSRITKLNSNDVLESIEIIDNKENKNTLKIDGLFVAIGRIPENQNFAKTIDLDSNGYVIAKDNCHTNKPGIFVAGDNRIKELRQLVTATSDGAIAATEAIKYINRKNK